MGVQAKYEQVVTILFPDRASHWYVVALPISQVTRAYLGFNLPYSHLYQEVMFKKAGPYINLSRINPLDVNEPGIVVGPNTLPFLCF